MSGPGSSNGREFDMIREVLGLYSTYCRIFSAKFDYIFVRWTNAFAHAYSAFQILPLQTNISASPELVLKTWDRKHLTIMYYIPLGFTPCPTIWKNFENGTDSRKFPENET